MYIFLGEDFSILMKLLFSGNFCAFVAKDKRRRKTTRIQQHTCNPLMSMCADGDPLNKLSANFVSLLRAFLVGTIFVGDNSKY